MHQNGYTQLRLIQSVGDPKLVPEVGKANYDAVYLVALLVEQPGTLVGVFDSLYRPSGGGVFRQYHRLEAHLLQLGQQLPPALTGQLWIEKIPASYHDAKGLLYFHILVP